jgi:S1-C subfamily serine protease
MSVASDLSKSLTQAVLESERSVVRVEGRRRRPAYSGVAVAPDLVVTVDHGLEIEDEVGLGTSGGGSTTGRLVGRDPSTDLALLKVAAGGLTPVSWHAAADFAVGSLVLAVLRPGQTPRASLGILSAVGDSWRTPSGGKVERYLETDIASRPGLSGSLLVDDLGRALGLNNSGLLRGVSSVIPGATVARVSEALRAHGGIRKGFLGIGSYPVRLPQELRSELSQSSALLVVSVEGGTPAATAGLLLGDVLLQADGRALSHPSELLPFLEEERIGSALKLRILRAGAPKDVEVKVGQRGEAR